MGGDENDDFFLGIERRWVSTTRSGGHGCSGRWRQTRAGRGMHGRVARSKGEMRTILRNGERTFGSNQFQGRKRTEMNFVPTSNYGTQ